MRTGYVISGAGHAALALLILFGDVLDRNRLPPVEVADVQLISADDFAALTRPEAGPVASVTPPTQQAPQVSAPPTAPPPDARPSSAPRPEAADPAPAESAPAVLPDPALPGTEVAEVEPTPPAPPIPPDASDTPRPADPAPQAAPRVAPEAAPPPPPEVETAPQVTETATPQPQEEVETVVEDVTPTAPEEAATEIVTEAEAPDGRAPDATMRPRSRPQRLAAAPPDPVLTPAAAGETFAAASTPEAVPEPEPEPDPEPPVQELQEPPADAMAASIAQALAEANVAETAPTAGAAAGPPLTAGEKDALRVAVQACWNVGSLSSEALDTTVVVSIRMTRDARPDTASIRMEDWQGGSDSAARQAFEAAKRAIIICGRQGYALPPEKYDQWAEIEMTFNPENMRIR